jgi:hypothetical protein
MFWRRSKLKSLVRFLSLMGLVALSACGSEVTYSYFNVKVDIDQATVNDDLRRKIASCGFIVSGDDYGQVTLNNCELMRVPYNLGTVDFSTSRSRGTLQFKAVMWGLNREVLAEGTSVAVAIVPNSTTNTSVLAVGQVPSLDAGLAPAPAPGDAAAADAAAVVGDAGTPDGV